MKKIISSITLLILSITLCQAQDGNRLPNGYATFTEFENSSPSLSFNFIVKQRTQGNIFMTGGIANYKLENIKPKGDKEKLEKEIWGIIFNDTILIATLIQR